MKKMKTILLSCLCCLVLYSCKKNDDNTVSLKTYGFIKAGDSQSDGIKYVDIKDTTIEFPDSSKYYFSHDSTKSIALDINQDNEIDMTFSVSSCGSRGQCFYSTQVQTSSKCYVIINPFKQREHSVDPYSEYDVIKMSPKKIMNGDSVSYKTLNFQNRNKPDTLSCLSYWAMDPDYPVREGWWQNVKDQYLGFKLIEPNDTVYGWIRLDASCIKITLKDLGYRK